MERLTKVDNQSRLLAYTISDTGLPTIIMHSNPYHELIKRLKVYEDTGLEPEEIMDGKMLTGWIPVEEQMPEETQVSEFPSMKPLYKVSDECLVTFRTEKNLYVGFDNTVDGEWIHSDNVIAWLPKPEPYNPSN